MSRSDRRGECLPLACLIAPLQPLLPQAVQRGTTLYLLHVAWPSLCLAMPIALAFVHHRSRDREGAVSCPLLSSRRCNPSPRREARGRMSRSDRRGASAGFAKGARPPLHCKNHPSSLDLQSMLRAMLGLQFAEVSMDDITNG